METYVSIDIETTGPAPGLFSMISLGAAAFTGDGEQLDTFSVNLAELQSAGRSPLTMDWWQSQPEAWKLATKDQVHPGHAISLFFNWLGGIEGRKVAVGWPIAFDFAFVNWYLHRFAGSNPLGFAGIDLRSYAAGLLRSPSYYKLDEAEIKRIAGPRDTALVKHSALDDAIEQGRLWVALLREARNADTV